MASDVPGNVVTYDGSDSMLVPVDEFGDITSISCPSTTVCHAVDAYGNAAPTFTDGTWSAPEKIDSYYVIEAVSCATADACVAVDFRGKSIAMTGATWAAPLHVGASFYMASVSRPTDGMCAAATPRPGDSAEHHRKQHRHAPGPGRRRGRSGQGSPVRWSTNQRWIQSRTGDAVAHTHRVEDCPRTEAERGDADGGERSVDGYRTAVVAGRRVRA